VTMPVMLFTVQRAWTWITLQRLVVWFLVYLNGDCRLGKSVVM